MTFAFYELRTVENGGLNREYATSTERFEEVLRKFAKRRATDPKIRIMGVWKVFKDEGGNLHSEEIHADAFGDCVIIE